MIVLEVIGIDITIVENVSCYEQDGVVYLRLEDVARGLGFTTVATSGNEVIRWNRVRKYLEDFNIHTCEHDSYIPENVFYRLAMKAKNEVAENFQAKVADEIIPSIRKHGIYATDNTIENILTDPDFGIRLLTELKEERAAKIKAESERDDAIEQKQRAEKQVEEKTEQLRQQEPLVDFANHVHESDKLISMGKFAKMLCDKGLNIGRSRLFKYLREAGILMYDNIPYQRYINEGLFKVKEIWKENKQGTKFLYPTTYITGKGQVWLYKKIMTKLGLKSSIL